jgi:two-component system, NtrC family, nitrogen regulation response regulator NtrX
VIHVPALNDRDDDIPLIATYFLEEVCANMAKPLMKFDPDALEEIKNIQWTGNVRELRNVVERLAILCDHHITVNDIRKYAQPLKNS